MRVISKENAVFTFNAAHPPKCQIESGEIFWIEVEDAYRGQITDASVKRPELDTTKSTGPQAPFWLKMPNPETCFALNFLTLNLAHRELCPPVWDWGYSVK